MDDQSNEQSKNDLWSNRKWQEIIHAWNNKKVFWLIYRRWCRRILED